MRARRAHTLIWTLVMMGGLTGLSSFAVDYGRIQAVKTELQRGCDAAARAAAASLSAGTLNVQSQAIYWAAQNTADQIAIALLNSDIRYGTWAGGTFTVGGSSPNAVEVKAFRIAARGTGVPLMFGRFVGLTTCDVSAKTIARYTPNRPYAIIGLNAVSMNASSLIDSYDSSGGAYSLATANDNGWVASNDDIKLQTSAKIAGDATPGPGDTVTTSGSSSVTGSTSPGTSNITLATPTTPSSYIELGAVSLSGTGVLTLAGGTYHASSINFGGSCVVNVTGAATIYCSGAVTINSTAVIKGASPSMLTFDMTNSSSINIGGATVLWADIYAPLSSVTINSTAQVSGRVQCGTLNMSGSGQIHYDEAFGSGAASSISIVK